MSQLEESSDALQSSGINEASIDSDYGEEFVEKSIISASACKINDKQNISLRCTTDILNDVAENLSHAGSKRSHMTLYRKTNLQCICLYKFHTQVRTLIYFILLLLILNLRIYSIVYHCRCDSTSLNTNAKNGIF